LEYKNQVKLSNRLKFNECYMICNNGNFKLKTTASLTSVPCEIHQLSNSIKAESSSQKPLMIERKTLQTYLAQIVCCLDLLHIFGILCKDLRLDNILLDEQSQLKKVY
jgi:hypothetical protein